MKIENLKEKGLYHYSNFGDKNIMIYDGLNKNIDRTVLMFTAIWSQNKEDRDYIGKSLSWSRDALNYLENVNTMNEIDMRDLIITVLK